MAKTRIYITQPIAQSAIDRLEKRGDVEIKINPDATKILPYETLMEEVKNCDCLLYTSPSPRDQRGSRMPSSA